jgi:hypothetical protein
VDPARQHYQLAHTFAAFYDYNHLNAAGQPLTGPCTGLPSDPDCQPSLGAPNFLFPTGLESPYRYFPLEHSEVWTGTDYIAAGAYYSAGDRYQDPVLRQDGTQMAEAVAEQIWAPSAQANGFAFDAPESWVDNDTTKFRYPAYTRPLAIWDLIDAIQPLPSLAQAGGAPF